MDRWILVVLLGSAALGVRAGLALYGIGLSRSKNAASAGMRHLCDFVVTVIAFGVVGSTVVFFRSRTGITSGFGPPTNSADAVFLYAVMFTLASGVVAGVVAERSRFFPMLAVPAVLGAVTLPLAGNFAWHGWLAGMRFHDVAGASVVHLAGGACALVAAFMVGPRNGKYNRDGSSNAIPGHNLPLAIAGVALMTVAWLPYVLGGAALHDGLGPQTAVNVLLAGSAGGFAALFYSRFRYGKAEILLTFSGLLGGLVSISAAADIVGSTGALVIGGIGGILVPIASIAIDLVLRVDDPTAGIAIHGIGGLWGTLAAGLFAGGGVADKVKMLGVQALGAGTVIVIAAALSAGLFLLLRATAGIRSSEADEFDGLDLAEHDINAYPDFQQTMIKSYHLREA